MNAAWRSLRCASTMALVVGLTCAPAAIADPPPKPDDRFLPAPAPPAPTEPTKQVQSCSLLTLSESVDPTQVDGPVDDAVLQQLRQLSTGKGQTVAVIDTGVSTHPQLRDLVGGGDYVSTGDGTHDCDGHGTVVAGIIAAQPDPLGGNSFVGLAPDVRLLSIRQTSHKFGVRKQTGALGGVGDITTLAMAVRTAADLGAGVINISTVACELNGLMFDEALGAAVAYAVDVKDAVVVTAAGNAAAYSDCEQNPLNPADEQGVPNWDDLRTVVSPGWYDDYVLTVGSVDPDGLASEFTLAGPWVDVAAPGEAVLSLDPDGEGIVDRKSESDGAAETIFGTSYAAPMVSAVAALIRSRFPDLTARDVMRRIEDTASPGAASWNPTVGNGIVDPLAAVSNQLPVPAPTGPTAPKSVDLPDISVPTDDDGRRVALTGAGLCVFAFGALVGLRLLLRNRNAIVTGNHVAGD